MFKRDKPKEPVEVTALRDALFHYQDIKVIIVDKDSNIWTFYNDKLRGCQLLLAKPKVYDQGEDVVVEFSLRAENGKVG